MKSILLFTLLSLLNQNSFAQEMDETSIHNLYEQKKLSATNPATWDQVSQNQRSETYQVQKKDTLWDISRTLFGTGFLWPKVWQLNSRITNPHDIQPGHILRFYEGTMEQPPRVDVEEEVSAPVLAEGDIPEYVDEKVLRKQSQGGDIALPEGVEIPPPEFQPKSVLRKLPGSLGDLFHEDEGNYNAAGFAPEDKGLQKKKEISTLTNFFTEKLPQAVGQVIEIEKDSRAAGINDYILVRLDEPRGKKYVVYEAQSPLREWGRFKVLGYPIEIQGEIEILDQVDADEKLYKARVVRSIAPVFPKSFLRPGVIPTFSSSSTGEVNQTPTRIIGGQYDDTRKVLGLHSIVYIDAGTSRGVQVGQIFPVLKNLKARNSNSVLGRAAEEIGRIKIIHATMARATGLVVSASQEITTGDTTGIPAK